MSNGARLVWYLVALVLALVACVVEIAQSKRVTPIALMAAVLGVFALVPFYDAVKAS